MSNVSTNIKGLKIIRNFITRNEEIELLNIMKNIEWNGTLLRKSRHFGYNYNYKTKTITKDDYIGNLPEWSEKYISRMLKNDLINKYPNQITVNRYLPGEGIAAHIDVPDIFDNDLYSISLGSGCNIILESEYKKEEYYIEPRTFMLFRDQARYEYTHCIKRLKYDIIGDREVQRNTRYSVTFRNVLL
tara:strand:+ start:2110 stop:2673 length:564 start_codon:yes stop_codon:yes gene_type:complete